MPSIVSHRSRYVSERTGNNLNSPVGLDSKLLIPRSFDLACCGALQEALAQIAAQKGTTSEAIIEQVITAGGPSVNATQADNVRFHDDRSTYTGVYAKGGEWPMLLMLLRTCHTSPPFPPYSAPS